MRVALIAPPWVAIPPPAYGGIEAMLDCLARGLVRAGHEVLLVATGDSTCPVPTRWVIDRAVGTAGVTPALEIQHVIFAYDQIIDWGADIVHDHTLVGPLYGERFGVPVITTNHGPFDGELGDLYRAIAPTVPVIAISNHHAAAAIGVHPSVIHHGIDVDAFPFGSGDGGYALFLGRMCPDKGVGAAATIARRAGVPLRIAGKMREPAERQYFEERVEPLLGPDIEFVGEVGGSQKLELLADAMCLLNPLEWDEPFGMVMVEALACGTPVVATPRGSVPELITDGVTGFVRPTETELVDAVHRVGGLDRARCRKEVRDRFSTERMVSDHLQLYQQVIAQHRLLQAA